MRISDWSSDVCSSDLPIKRAAVERGIEVFQPESLKSQVSRDALAALKPDLLVVVAYGLILPKSILSIPTHGCWNVHASLLPRWRGAAPIQRAIEAGDTGTGVCLMQMEAGLDTGLVLLSQPLEIGADETGGPLHDRLRSEERRVGKECVSPCRLRGSPAH